MREILYPRQGLEIPVVKGYNIPAANTRMMAPHSHFGPRWPPAYSYQYPYPQYYHYPPPPMYWPGYYYQPPKRYTQEGTRFFCRALLVQLVLSAASFAIGIFAITLLRSGYQQASFPFSTSFVIRMEVVILVDVLALAIFALLLIGAVMFYTGKGEHGPRHDRNVVVGIILFIASYVLPIAGAIMAAGAILSSAFTGGTMAEAPIRSMTAIIGAFSLAAATCTAMMYRTMISAFMGPEDGMFKIAAVLWVLAPIVSISITLATIPSTLQSDIASNLLTSALGIGGVIGILAVYIFHRGYRRVLDRMGSKELKQGVVPEDLQKYLIGTTL